MGAQNCDFATNFFKLEFSAPNGALLDENFQQKNFSTIF